MKTRNFTPGGTTARHPRPADESGFAVLAILVLLSVMLLLIGSNARVLGHLKAEIKLIDQRQQLKFAAPTTNAVPAAVAAPRN